MTGGSPPEKKQIWGRLLILLLPLVAAVAFSAWWVQRTPAPESSRPGKAQPAWDLDRLAGQASGWLGSIARHPSVQELLGTPADREPRTAVLRRDASLDLESADQQPSSVADLRWILDPNNKRPYLALKNGALVSLLGTRKWESVDASALHRLAHYRGGTIQAWGASAPVRAGEIIAVRTVEGNYAKVLFERVAEDSSELALKWLLHPGPPDDGRTWTQKLEALMDAQRDGRRADAEKLAAEALAAAEAYGSGDPRVALVLFRTALTFVPQRPADAEKALLRAGDIVSSMSTASLEEVLGSGHRWLAPAIQTWLGHVLKMQNRFGDAAMRYRASAKLSADAGWPVDERQRALERGSALYEAAMAECRLGRRDAAREDLRQARLGEQHLNATAFSKALLGRIQDLDRKLAAASAC